MRDQTEKQTNGTSEPGMVIMSQTNDESPEESQGHPDLTKEKGKGKGRRSFFPILIELIDEKKQMVVTGMAGLPVRKPIQILEANYQPSWKSVEDD